MAYKKILVALDGSELAEAALPHAQQLASDPESEIVLLRISVNPAAEFSFSDPHIADNIIQEMETETLTYLQSVRGTLQKTGFRTSFLICQAAIAETILRTAAEIYADIVVMSTHGRSGMKRWLLGSVADRVVTHSDLLVMLSLLVLVQVVFVTMVYGPIAAFPVELFPTKIRYTSMSLPYHIGNGVFGGLVPIIGLSLIKRTGNDFAGLWYPLAIATICAGVCYLAVPETAHVNIEDDSVSPFAKSHRRLLLIRQLSSSLEMGHMPISRFSDHFSGNILW